MPGHKAYGGEAIMESADFVPLRAASVPDLQGFCSGAPRAPGTRRGRG